MIYLTLSVTMNPTDTGPRMDVNDAILLVIPNNVPAKFGAKSKWLVMKPEKTPPFKITTADNKIDAAKTDVSKK